MVLLIVYYCFLGDICVVSLCTLYIMNNKHKSQTQTTKPLTPESFALGVRGENLK